MTEFQEVMYQMNRFCNSMTCDCEDCEIYKYSSGVCLADVRLKDNGAALENKIMSWAAAHPAPKYPTWGEYLCNIGLINDCTASEDAIYRLFNNTIPADIAQKLSIEPKEETYDKN